MKKILLLSDTHGHLDEAALNYAEDRDEIWHAGDIGRMAIVEKLQKIKPVRAVYGNIDGADVRKFFPENVVIDVEGMKFFMTHIAGPLGKYNARVKEILKNEKPQVLVCGHSHILKVMRDAAFDLMYINPGAAGREGFHKIKTMLRFSVENGKLLDLQVVELGLRGKIR